MIKSKKQSFIIIGVFALVLMLGTVTYAFFNYTRTGSANTIRTGRISFNTSQTNTLSLTNVFPMSEDDVGNANLDAVSVRIQGDTTYSGGEEYEISIVDVNNTIGSGASAKTIPINYIVSYSATPVQSGDPNVIGESSDSYFTARGQSSPVYQLSATGEATNGEQVLIGYIPSGATGIDGTLTIKAYLDSSKIAISDTYNNGNTPTDNLGTPASFGEGRVVLTTTEWNALQNTQTPLSFKIKAVSQEGTWLIPSSITINYNLGGGTMSSNSKTIAGNATTYGPLEIPTKINNLFEGWYTAETGGTKVEASTSFVIGTSATTLYAHWEDLSLLPSTISTCNGCVYKYTTDDLYFNNRGYVFGTNDAILQEGDYDTDYKVTVANSGKRYFLGFVLDGEGYIEKAYACGLKGESPNKGTPYCLEGGYNADYYTVEENANILQNIYGVSTDENWYTNGCYYFEPGSEYYNKIFCDSRIILNPYSLLGDYYGVHSRVGQCDVSDEGYAFCSNSQT